MAVALPTLLVMAAGLGSRYGGLKPLEPVGPSGETLLDYAVYDALRTGFGRVVLVVRRETEPLFRSRVRPFAERVEVAFAHQEPSRLPAGVPVPPGRTKPWGTCHALLAARDALDGPFAAVNGDDFYGASAYRLAGDFLAREAAADAAALVAFPLGRTLSEHGPVTRAACRLEDGWLTGLDERHGLQRGRLGGLAPDSLVSMNFWAMTPEALAGLEESFVRFLEARGRDLEAELPIPVAMADLVRSGALRVRVLEASGPWLGVTFKEDRGQVAAGLRALVREGAYPPSLWGGA